MISRLHSSYYLSEKWGDAGAVIMDCQQSQLFFVRSDQWWRVSGAGLYHAPPTLISNKECGRKQQTTTNCVEIEKINDYLSYLFEGKCQAEFEDKCSQNKNQWKIILYYSTVGRFLTTADEGFIVWIPWDWWVQSHSNISLIILGSKPWVS